MAVMPVLRLAAIFLSIVTSIETLDWKYYVERESREMPGAIDLNTIKCDPRIHALFDTGLLYNTQTISGSSSSSYESRLTPLAERCAGNMKRDCSPTVEEVKNIKDSFDTIFNQRRRDVWRADNVTNKGEIAVCQRVRDGGAKCAYVRLYTMTNLFYNDAKKILNELKDNGQMRKDVFLALTDLTEIYIHHPDVSAFCQQPRFDKGSLTHRVQHVDMMVTPVELQYELVEIVTLFRNAEDSSIYKRYFPNWHTFSFKTLENIDEVVTQFVHPKADGASVDESHFENNEFKDTFYYRVATAFGTGYLDKLKIKREMKKTCSRDIKNHFCFIYQQSVNMKLYLDNKENAKTDNACALLLKLNNWLKSLSEIWTEFIYPTPNQNPSNTETWSGHEELLKALLEKVSKMDKTELKATMKCLNTEIQLKQECKTGVEDRTQQVICKAQNVLIRASRYIRNYDRKRMSVGYKDLKTYLEFLTRDIFENNIKNAVREVGDQVSSEVKSLGKKLQNYFFRVANFNERKAKEDNAYLMGRLNEHNATEWREETKKLGGKIDTLTGFAIAMETVDAVQDVATSAVFIFTLDFDGFEESWFDSLNSVLDLAVAVNIKLKLSELAAVNLDILDGFQKNMKYIKGMNQAFALITDDPAAVTKQREDLFLLKYGGYTPQIKEHQLTLLVAKLEAYREKVCEILYQGDNTAVLRAAFELKMGNTACQDIAAEIEEYGQKLQDIYDFQFEIMESYASFMHASVSKTAATEIATQQIDHVQHTDISYMNVMLQLEKWTALQEYCFVRKYVERGVAPLGCDNVPHLLPRELLSVNQRTLCDIRTKKVSIPVTKTPDSELESDKKYLGYIKFKKLFNEKPFSFQIPNKEWLVDNNWITPLDAKSEPVIYLMNLKFIVPFDESAEKTTVTVTGTLMGDNKLSPTADESYDIDPQYHLSYQYEEGKDAKMDCATPVMANPYQICEKKKWRLNPICFNSVDIRPEPIDDRHLYPSIYARWKFQVNGYGFQRNNIPVPEARNITEAFKYEMKLQAYATYCITPTWAMKKTKQTSLETDLKHKRSIETPPDKCCKGNKYYSKVSRRCDLCPGDSKKMLEGYYCAKSI